MQGDYITTLYGVKVIETELLDLDRTPRGKRNRARARLMKRMIGFRVGAEFMVGDTLYVRRHHTKAELARMEVTDRNHEGA